jgi:hypothetical protein
MKQGRSQWLRGLRRRSAAARLLRLWFRIPSEAWMFLGFVVPYIFKHSNKTPNQMQQSIVKFNALSLLDKFRDLLCPSSVALSNIYECLCVRYESRGGHVSSCGRLETCPPPHSYGNLRLQWQFERAPDDGHSNARNMSSSVCATKQYILRMIVASGWVFYLNAWMFVMSVVWCQVEVSVTSWSLVQRSPNDCDVSLYVI